jgi:ATP-dependent Clp protease adaptor protein ClpS
MAQVQEKFETELLEQLVEEKDLIIYNDDYNTFDFVIDTLKEICEHETEQAVQCTWIIHYKGKCSVKRGAYEALVPLCTALLERGLNAEIE